jgi:alkaline phosphatase
MRWILSVIFTIFISTFISEVLSHVLNNNEKNHHMHPTSNLVDNKNFRRLKRDDKSHHEEIESTSNFWRHEAQKKLVEQLKKRVNRNVAKNLILFLGDGMSIPTITAARIYSGQKRGFSGEESSLSFEEFPYIGLSKTYCYDKQTADSACSATAYLTGVKANYATLGVNPKVRLDDCEASLNEENHANSIMTWAQKSGKATGIVTTTRITHASPAGSYAHSANRDWESDFDMMNINNTEKCLDIAEQLVRQSPGKDFNVIFGGGRKKFYSEKILDEEGIRGERKDELDLIDEWLSEKNSSKAQYIYHKNGLDSLNLSSFDHVLGLFDSDHIAYKLDNDVTNPTLKEMTVAAIELMKKNPKGFVLFVEGGRIDHGHHNNLARHALEETVEFAKAVQAATEITDEKDTLIVVTSDHAHTMSLSGYSHRGTDILGLNSKLSDIDDMPYMSLSYANGPSGGKQRYKMTENEMGKNFARNL